MDHTTSADRDRRRRRLLGGLLLGVAAVGLPALANRLIARSAPRLRDPGWGRVRTYRWGRGEVRFRDLGDGPPLVLLHGLGRGRDGEEWRPVAEALASQYRVLVPDLPGWGLSTDPRLRVVAQVYPAFVRDFLVDVVAEPSVVVAAGHLAPAAVRALLENGVEAAGLAVVCPHGIGDLRRPTLWTDRLLRLALPLPILGESALNGVTSRAAIASALTRDLYFAPERVDAQVVDHAYRAAHRPGAFRALGALFGGQLEDEVGDLVSRIEQPTLVMWGRACRDPGVENADPWLARLGSDAELEVFESSAQLPHVEEARAFAQRLGDFASSCFEAETGSDEG